MDPSSLSQLKAALEAAGSKGASPSGPQGAPAAVPFGDILQSALTSVSKVEGAATQMQTAFQRGDAGASLEQTMIAMQKSQLAFQATLTVRNRLVSAYTDIMNMPV
ncbi:MAG: flagellar hook-basal body complex protein FliE [Burkholderiaceae bacterium]